MSGWDARGDLQDLEQQLDGDRPRPLRRRSVIIVCVVVIVSVVGIGLWASRTWCPVQRADADWECAPTGGVP